MSKAIYFFVTLFCVTAHVYGETCQQPEVEIKTFSTQDATVVSEIAIICEFSLKCPNAGVLSSLYAEVDGVITSVAKIGDKYQISWTGDVKKIQSGDHYVRLFDEDGYATLRKAARSGEDPSTIQALSTFTVNHPGAFTGPWLKSEFMAAALSIIVAYIAFSSKAKLLA